jgi:hypothetical protein
MPQYLFHALEDVLSPLREISHHTGIFLYGKKVYNKISIIRKVLIKFFETVKNISIFRDVSRRRH